MKNTVLIFALLPALLAWAAAPCRAQEAAVSTAPAAQSPLILNISKDFRSTRVGLDYSVRWDFSDLASFRPNLGAVYSGLKAVSSWDITENTRVNYYGLKTNPWRVIIAKEKPAAPVAADGGVVDRGNQVYRKRVRLSVSPLVDDIKRNFDDNLSEFLLRSSLKGVSPEWERIGAQNRRAFVKDVLSLPGWGSSLPLVGEAREGLEYLSEPGKKPAASRQ
ncbi:MAG TPA: hypothetical protein DCS63_04015 [Elusimicrobia bacterium]|nr:hypothetical protein [Elusimicrobiota bacterium]